MSRYSKGNYRSVANEDNFNKIIGLKSSIQMIAGLDQNDMVITQNDLQYCEDQINSVISTLNSWFENKLDSLTLLQENN